MNFFRKHNLQNLADKIRARKPLIGLVSVPGDHIHSCLRPQPTFHTRLRRMQIFENTMGSANVRNLQLDEIPIITVLQVEKRAKPVTGDRDIVFHNDRRGVPPHDAFPDPTRVLE